MTSVDVYGLDINLELNQCSKRLVVLLYRRIEHA